MKLFRIHDEWNGKIRWEGYIGRANFVASLWVSELELQGHNNAESWVKLDELDNKEQILTLLNINNRI